MSIDSGNSRIGMGLLTRAGKIILVQKLNAAIAAENDYWIPLDEELATLEGVEYTPMEIEVVASENFHLGHNPSLIEASVEKYPNVSVDADRAGSSGNDDLDQGSMFGISLYIEFMVKSEKNEEEVSDRAMRMLDAINAVMMSNKTLGGSTHEIGTTPIAQLSDVFVRPGDTSYGKDWFWRGGRIEYTIDKVAMNSGTFASAGYDIDQE